MVENEEKKNNSFTKTFHTEMFIIYVHIVTFPYLTLIVPNFTSQFHCHFERIFKYFIEKNNNHAASINQLVGDIIESGDIINSDENAIWRWKEPYRSQRKFNITHPNIHPDYYKLIITLIEPTKIKNPSWYNCRFCLNGKISHCHGYNTHHIGYQCTLRVDLKNWNYDDTFIVNNMSVNVVITPKIESLKIKSMIALCQTVKLSSPQLLERNFYELLKKQWIEPAGLSKLMGQIIEFVIEPDSEDNIKLIKKFGGKCLPKPISMYRPSDSV